MADERRAQFAEAIWPGYWLPEDLRLDVMDRVMAIADPPLAEIVRLKDLIRDLADPDPCWFDHNGGCQAHGYLSLKPGETCPQADAQAIIKETE